MIPYIAALVILIVAILFTVYSRVDQFSTDASGNTVPQTDASGNTIGGVNAKDLYEVLTGVKQALQASNVSQDINTTTSKPKDTMEHEGAPAPSVQLTKELEERLSKNIATQVKDSLLAQRSTQNPLEDMACPYAAYESSAVAQGQEYRHAKPSPDMSEYIRKDSIPCWNCSLP